MKKAFSLAEVLLAFTIIGIMAVFMIRVLDPQRYEHKTNLAKSRKTLETISAAIVDMLDTEKTQIPTRSFMIRPSGKTDLLFSVSNRAGNAEASASDIVDLLENHLKYETDSLNFCDYTSYCDDDDIIGARLAGGAYFGIEKFDAITDCPSYLIPGEETESLPPVIFTVEEPTSGDPEYEQCWGKLYIDISGNKGENTYGEDVYVFGLGENGIIR